MLDAQFTSFVFHPGIVNQCTENSPCLVSEAVRTPICLVVLKSATCRWSLHSYLKVSSTLVLPGTAVCLCCHICELNGHSNDALRSPSTLSHGDRWWYKSTESVNKLCGWTMKLTWNNLCDYRIGGMGRSSWPLGLRRKGKRSWGSKICHMSHLPFILSCYANKKIFCMSLPKVSRKLYSKWTTQLYV